MIARAVMAYIERNLTPGEEVLLRPRYHYVRFLNASLVALAGIAVALVSFFVPASATETWPSGLLVYAGAALVLLALVMAGWRALVDSFDEFGLTTLRVIKKTGVLNRVVRQIPLDKVQDVNIHATLGGRWLSYGDVELQTAGSDSTVVFPRIRNPEEFRNALFAHLHPAVGAAVPALPAGEPPRTAPSVEARLAELERLREKGVVTEDEYREKRRALLAEL